MNSINYLSCNWLVHKINNDAFRGFSSQIHGRVVDLGCGTCQYRQDILNLGGEYVGVDWENSLHDQSQVDVFADLCKRLPFRDTFADAVVSFQVLEHLPEPGLFLSECFRILKPGGSLFVTVPFMWHVHEAPHDYFRYTRHGLDYLLKKGGFDAIHICENTGFWQMWILKLNYHSLRFSRGPLKYLFFPFWWLGQVVAPILDRFDRHPAETVSYTVIARKPSCL